MLVVFAIAALIWFGGRIWGVPARLRAWLVALLYAVVVLSHLILPAGTPLREATGGRAEPWIVLGGVMALIIGYRAVLRQVKARATPVVESPAAPAPDKLTGPELERYTRHIVLREVGGAGQKRLKTARVLVVGAGGLGSPVILYLAAAGVGTIGVIDDDAVDPGNLQRQILHADDRIGMPKVQSAQIAALALNPYVTLRPYQQRLTEENAAALIADYDLVMDGTDNFDTRYLVNRTCVALGKPLISGAMSQWEGQVAVYDPARGGPCMECVFPVRPAPGMAPACAEAGVIAPLPGVIGSLMALEAVKRITNAGEGLLGRLLIHDGLYAETRIITTRARADCPVCGADPAAHERGRGSTMPAATS